MRIVLLLFLFFTYSANAQFITTGSGDWNNGAIWNMGTPPNSSSGSITINHAVTIPSGYSVTIDQVTLNSSLVISTGGVVTLTDGTGVDLTISSGSSITVNGELIRNNLSTLNQVAGSSMSFEAASIYRHRYTTTEGIPPLATWSATSNFYLEGYTSSSAIDLTSSQWTQSYGNFIYNCTGQRNLLNVNGLITNIQRNFLVQGTGTNVLQLTDSENNRTISVGGNLTISGTSRVNFSVNGTGGIMNLTGNLTYTTISSLGSYLTNTGSYTVNIAGDFFMNAGNGRLFMAGALGGTGISTLNLYRNFTLTSGQISESGSSTANGNIRFVGNGTFSYVNTGTVINRINYFIASTVILDLSTYGIMSGTNSAFRLDGTIICGSLEPTGAIINSTTLGNIRTYFPLRVYSSGSTVIYRGTSAQSMGNGQPSTAGVTTILDNSAGVTQVASPVTINGTLQLKSGMFFINGNTLNLNGAITYNTGILGGNTTSVLAIGGTAGGDFGNLNFDPSKNALGTLTLNRTGANSSVTLINSLTVDSKLNLTNGSFNNNSQLTVADGAVVTRYATASLLGNRLNHNVGDLYDLIYRTSGGVAVNFLMGLELPTTADALALNNLTIRTALAADIVQLPYDIVINGDVTLSAGKLLSNTFNITMRGNTWADNSGNFIAGSGSVKFSGNTTIFGSSVAFFSNVQLTSGNSLTLGRNTNFSGNVDFQATSNFDPSIYTVTLNGTTLQTISANGANFFNLDISKTSGNVQLTSNTGLTGLFRFATPTKNCTLQSNGFLTLVSASDAAGSGTAQIYRLLSGNTVTGDVTVQRYMSGEGRIYRYLSSPVTNATVASWQDDFPITGRFTGHSNSTGLVCGMNIKPNVPSLFYYNEATPGDVEAGYIAYPTSGTAATNSLQVGKGYAAFVRNCDAPTVVDVTGPINQGTITFPVTYTNNGDATADGYNLIGNPFPCSIDWDLSGWTKTRISPVISIRDNGNAGMMLYWDGTAGGIANGHIAPGQAFWVRATAAAPILRVTENAKSTAPNQSAEFYRKPQTEAVDFLTISLSDGKIKDKAFVKLRSQSEDTLDDWDAPKINNDVFDLYAVSQDGIAMAIDSRKSLDNTTIIQLGIQDLEQKTYTLSLENYSGDFKTYSYELIDNYKHISKPFTDPYAFIIDSNPASFRKDRFKIRLIPNTENSFSNLNLIYPNPVDRFVNINGHNTNLENITISDNLGKVISTGFDRDGDVIVLDLKGFTSGVYTLSLLKDGVKQTYKIIKK